MSSRKQKILESMRNSPKSVKYADLEWLCNEEFGSARQKGSHRIWNSGKKPDSRITLQPDGKNAKPYQVRQVLKALLG